MTPIIDLFVGALLVIGSLFTLIAAVGLLRLPDLYTRMHAASKAGTLGSGLMLIAISVGAGELDVITRGLAGVIFFLLTAPVSAHLLARAAHLRGYRMAKSTRINALETYETPSG